MDTEENAGHVESVHRLEYEAMREAYLRQPDSADDADDWANADDWIE